MHRSPGMRPLRNFLSIWLCLGLPCAAQRSDPLELATKLEGQSEVEFQHLNWSEAEALRAQAVELRKRAGGEQAIATGMSLERLGQIYNMHGKLESAEAVLLSAVGIQRLNPAQPEVAGSLTSLGNNYLLRGRFAQAKAAFDESLRLTMAISGAARAQIESLVSLSSYYRIVGEYARAEPLLNRALAIGERSFGPNDPMAAATLTNFGVLASEQGNDALAALHYQRALRIFRVEEKPAGMSTGLTEALLGDVYVRQGKLAEARALLLDAVEIERKALGRPHRNLGMTLSSLADLYVKTSDPEKADASFRESIAMFEQSGAAGDPVFAGTLQRYARLLRKSKRKTEAERLEGRANIVLAFHKSHRP